MSQFSKEIDDKEFEILYQKQEARWLKEMSMREMFENEPEEEDFLESWQYEYWETSSIAYFIATHPELA